MGVETLITGAVFSVLSSNAVTFSLAGSAFAIQAISAAVQAGLYLGASALLAGGNRRPAIQQSSDAKETIRLSAAPVTVVLGRARIGGNIFFGNSKKVASAGNRNTLFRGTAHCKGRVDAIEEVFLNGRPVVVDSDTKVSSPPYATFTGGVASSWAFIDIRLGESTETAFSSLLTNFPDLWTSAHRGDEVCQTLGVYVAPDGEEWLRLYPNGKPVVELLVRGERVYDPRTGSSAWSDNGVLCVLHYLLLPSEYGWGMSSDDFDMTDIAAEANKADFLIPLKGGGSERRSRCSGAYSTNRNRGEVLAELLLSTGTQIVQLQNGLYSIRLTDDNPIAEMEFTEDSILDFTWSASPETVEKPNRAVLRYYSAEQNYEMADVPLQSYDGGGNFTGVAWSIDQDEIDRTGERVDEFNLNFCPSHGQASRIVRRLFAIRRAPRGEIRANLRGMGALGRTVADIAFPELDETMKCQMISPRFEDDGVSVSIPYVEHPTLGTWTPASDEPDAPDVLPDASYSSDLSPPTGLGALAMKVGEGAGTSDEIRVFVNPAGLNTIEVNFRPYSGGVAGAWQSMFLVDPGTVPFVTSYYPYTSPAGQQFDFRARTYDAGTGDVSQFSEIVNVPSLGYDNTAPAAPTFTGVRTPASNALASFTLTVGSPYAAYVVVEQQKGGGAWTEVERFDVWPKVYNFSIADTDAADYRARLFTSNNTPGAYSSTVSVIAQDLG